MRVKNWFRDSLLVAGQNLESRFTVGYGSKFGNFRISSTGGTDPKISAVDLQQTSTPLWRHWSQGLLLFAGQNLESRFTVGCGSKFVVKIYRWLRVKIWSQDLPLVAGQNL